MKRTTMIKKAWVFGGRCATFESISGEECDGSNPESAMSDSLNMPVIIHSEGSHDGPTRLAKHSKLNLTTFQAFDLWVSLKYLQISIQHRQLSRFTTSRLQLPHRHPSIKRIASAT